jgi:hypothetical protein
LLTIFLRSNLLRSKLYTGGLMPFELEVSPSISLPIESESKNERDVFVATITHRDKHVTKTWTGD